MYQILLILHSNLRWVLLFLAVMAIFKAFSGWQNNKPFLKADNSIGAALVGITHLQLLLGLILYFGVSPVTQAIFQNFGAAMKNATERFWAVEHITGMIIGVILIQLGRILSKKAKYDTDKHKKAFIYFTIGFLIILLSIPFGILNHEARPLFRF